MKNQRPRSPVPFAKKLGHGGPGASPRYPVTGLFLVSGDWLNLFFFKSYFMYVSSRTATQRNPVLKMPHAPDPRRSGIGKMAQKLRAEGPGSIPSTRMAAHNSTVLASVSTRVSATHAGNPPPPARCLEKPRSLTELTCLKMDSTACFRGRGGFWKGQGVDTG